MDWTIDIDNQAPYWICEVRDDDGIADYDVLGTATVFPLDFRTEKLDTLDLAGNFVDLFMVVEWIFE